MLEGDLLSHSLTHPTAVELEHERAFSQGFKQLFTPFLSEGVDGIAYFNDGYRAIVMHESLTVPRQLALTAYICGDQLDTSVARVIFEPETDCFEIEPPPDRDKALDFFSIVKSFQDRPNDPGPIFVFNRPIKPNEIKQLRQLCNVKMKRYKIRKNEQPYRFLAVGHDLAYPFRLFPKLYCLYIQCQLNSGIYMIWLTSFTKFSKYGDADYVTIPSARATFFVSPNEAWSNDGTVRRPQTHFEYVLLTSVLNSSL